MYSSHEDVHDPYEVRLYVKITFIIVYSLTALLSMCLGLALFHNSRAQKFGSQSIVDLIKSHEDGDTTSHEFNSSSNEMREEEIS